MEPADLKSFDVSALAAEQLRRQRGRSSLAEFARSVEVPGVPMNSATPEEEMFKPVETALAPHHLIILNEIQRCIETHDGRLIIQAPPGSAKSTYASVVAPTWIMGKVPGYRVILTSYASDIAVKQSRKARALCRQAAYTSIFPSKPTLDEAQRAADEWSLTHNDSASSEFMAAGLLAGITGNRADLVVIDDPIANREAADSPTLRDKAYSEYVDSVLTRLKPGASVIICNTRWHEDDLCGRILPEDYHGQSGDVLCQDGLVWRVVNLPAKAEQPDDPLGRAVGEYLWPEWFPVTHWAKWEGNPRARRTWSALFQQRPTAGEGLQFARADAQWYTEATKPAFLRVYGASDYATKEEAGDYTAHIVVGFDKHGNLFLLDQFHGQKESNKTIAAFILLLTKWKPTRWAQEGGPIWNAIKPAVNRAMREANDNRGQYVTIEKFPTVGDKAFRLESFAARYQAKSVYFPADKPWGEQWLAELIGFPAAKYDDRADALGLIGRLIDMMHNPHIPVVERKPELVPFTARWIEWNDQSDKPKVRFFA